MDVAHKPVLLKEVLEYLQPKSGQVFVDGTANGGGHTFAIAERVEPNGIVIAIEWDSEIASDLELKVKSLKFKDNIRVINDSYTNLKNILEQEQIKNIDGIVLDLGFSSIHLEESGRGFSFQKDEPLDMRYNVGDEIADKLKVEGLKFKSITAAEIINTFREEDIADIIYKYGEERFSRQIAKKIIEERRKKRILTTFELVEVIKSAVPVFYRKGKINCATKTFQALRIAVNKELENLENVLSQIVEVLNFKGRIAIISFHSLEDRIVKNFFKDKAKEGVLKIITKKPVVAGEEEIKENPRARSAKLRIAEKI